MKGRAYHLPGEEPKVAVLCRIGDDPAVDAMILWLGDERGSAGRDKDDAARDRGASGYDPH
jgi:hypothetical protein